jgi:hypothetical protein
VRYYFTKRHEEALREKRLKPYIPLRLRVTLQRTLNRFSSWGGYDNEENDTFLKTEETLKTFYGEEQLFAYDDDSKLVPTNLNGLIKSGYPARVFDLIEAWYDHAENMKANECEKELNSLFEIHNSPWRIVNGTIILVDSEYVHDEIVAKTQCLLKEHSVIGALDEFNDAISFLMDGQTKEAIINAHKSVESVMKTCLGTDEHLTFGGLLDRIIKSGMIPSYYEEFLGHFEKLSLGAVKERNLPARAHGQGSESTKVHKNLAEFAVNLAGCINLFLIRRWIEHNPKGEEVEESEKEDGILL